MTVASVTGARFGARRPARLVAAGGGAFLSLVSVAGPRGLQVVVA